MTSQVKVPGDKPGEFIVKVIKPLESDWQSRDVPDLRVVSDELRYQSQARLDLSLEVYHKRDAGENFLAVNFSRPY